MVIRSTFRTVVFRLWAQILLAALLPSIAWAEVGGPSTAPEATAPQSEPPALSTAIAEPISPAMVRRFPHLAEFQGHVLLAGPNLQVVVAGVPPRALSTPWRPAVLSVYHLERQSWSRHRAVGTIDLRNTAGPDYRAMAVDMGTDGGAAFASFIYAVEGQKSLRQIVTYRFDAEAGRLGLVFDDYADGDKAAKAAHKWQLRLHPGAANVVVPKQSSWGGQQGLSHLLTYAGTDVLGVVGYRAFQLNPEMTASVVELVPQSNGRDHPIEGFEFFFKGSSDARLLRRVDDVRECLFGAFRPKVLPRPEARHNWILGCATDAPRTILRLRLPAGDAGGDRVSQPVFVFGPDGELLQYAALHTGEVVDVDVPHSVLLQLADTSAGRLIGDFEPTIVGLGETKTIDLPARSVGTIKLDLVGDKSAALLTIKSAEAGAVDAGVVRIEAAGAEPVQLAPNSWLVKAWPVALDLVQGTYELQVARGDQGVFCRSVMAVQQRAPEIQLCASEAPKDSSYLYADLSAVGVSAESRAFGMALGVRWLPRVLDAADADSLKESASDDGSLPVLTAVDEATGVVMRLMPATSAMAKRWAKVRPATAQNVLAAFVDFARTEVRGAAVLELSCPSRGISLYEYERLVKRLNPDAVRLFGCEGAGAQRDLLELWTRLSVARKSPFVLTPSSELDRPRPGFGRFPRLAVAKTPKVQDTIESMVASLASHRASIVNGMRVDVVGLSVKEQDPKAPKSKGSREVEVRLTVTPLGVDVPVTVVVYTDAGMIKQESLAAVKESTSLLSSFSLPDSALWLRVEVVAASAGKVGEDEQILATTGFLSLGDLLPTSEPLTEKQSNGEKSAPAQQESSP